MGSQKNFSPREGSIKWHIIENLQEILEILEHGMYNVEPGNKAEAIRVWCERNGFEYSENWRKRFSEVANAMMSDDKENPEEDEAKRVHNPGKGGEFFHENMDEGTATQGIVTNQPIHTLEQLLQVCEIDTSVWTVYDLKCNAWGVSSWKNGGQKEYGTNYQVTAKMRRRELDVEETFEQLVPLLKEYKPRPLSQNVLVNPGGKHGGVGVLSVADFHLGADIKDLIRTRNFNPEILMDYLHAVADRVNREKYEKVVVNILGDLVESITGLNHLSTFKSLGQGMWGANVLIQSYVMIRDHFLASIQNLSEVNMVAGNHDRITPSKDIDNMGEGANIVAFMLQQHYGDSLDINFHPLLINKEIDGMFYILTHGDKGLSKKHPTKLVADFGDNEMFNLILEGHLHSLAKKKTVRRSQVDYQDVSLVSIDDMNYRQHTIPPLFTGNYWSESMGFASTAGAQICTNAGGRGFPETIDIIL
jgi:hypothetical protein